MSRYTMQLKTYIERFSQHEEGLSINDKIEIGRPKLFSFDYPLFDPDYKKIFETHFIRKFYFREIGFETEELFKFYLETWLSINMPYFNKMFESELIEFDPLVNSEMKVNHTLEKDKNQADVRETSNKSTANSISQDERDSTGNATGNDFERKISSNNPDGRLNLTTQEGKGVIEYANNIDEQTLKSEQNSTQNVNTTSNNDFEGSSNQDDNLSSNINEIEDYVQHRQGKIGVVSYADLIVKYRNSFMRVENIIHNEMQELFMLVY